MTEPHPAPTARTRTPGPRRSRVRQAVAALWSAWRVEVLCVGAAALGLFLLFERLEIRETVVGWLRQGRQTATQLGSRTLDSMMSIFQRATLSDLAGVLLLLGAFLFIAWRVRWRLVTSPRFSTQTCPHCGSDLHRIHRTRLDRALDRFVPVMRCRCKNRECRWEGLRVRNDPHE